MKVIEVEGRTPDDATKKAMAELGIRDTSKVTVEIIDPGKSGIFGFGVSRPAKVRIYYNESTENVGSKVKETLMALLSRMNIEGGVKDIKESESKVYVELESKTSSGLLIGKKGKTLEALQFMINLMINNSTGSEKKIILDIESYRDKREKALKKMSRDIAFKVIKTGRPMILEPMNPFERRLIHTTLNDIGDVDTKSEGEGLYKQVRVFFKGR